MNQSAIRTIKCNINKCILNITTTNNKTVIRFQKCQLRMYIISIAGTLYLKSFQPAIRSIKCTLHKYIFNFRITNNKPTIKFQKFKFSMYFEFGMYIISIVASLYLKRFRGIYRLNSLFISSKQNSLLFLDTVPSFSTLLKASHWILSRNLPLTTNSSVTASLPLITNWSIKVTHNYFILIWYRCQIDLQGMQRTIWKPQ